MLLCVALRGFGVHDVVNAGAVGANYVVDRFFVGVEFGVFVFFRVNIEAVAENTVAIFVGVVFGFAI